MCKLLVYKSVKWNSSELNSISFKWTTHTVDSCSVTMFEVEASLEVELDMLDAAKLLNSCLEGFFNLQLHLDIDTGSFLSRTLSYISNKIGHSPSCFVLPP